MFLLAAALLNVHLRMQTDEANAVLNILDKRAAHAPVEERDWRMLFGTEGYRRLQQREHSMKRKFEDDDFREFTMSDNLLARRGELRRAILDWERADLDRAAERALAYLPRDATITATIYPVIKPAKNSFVFEGNAIFMYIEDESRETFETIIAHELHHIGYDSACEHPTAGLPENLEKLQNWLTAFGEGYATLAAGGDRDPERSMKPEVHKAFQEGVRDFDRNFGAVEQFFLDILDRRLTRDAVSARGFEFFGLVGPWYTVGWKMCVTIEKKLGRQALIDAFCNPRTLLETYNKAAGPELPKWSPRLVNAFSSPSS